MLFSPILNIFRRKENRVFIKKGKNIVPLPVEPKYPTNPVVANPIVLPE
jgi:long-subunit acyl-CoA synthetase (AMP-forming)